MTGNVIAQFVSIGVSPIVTRLYSPENFGVLAVFIAFVNMLDKLATFSYERAIVLPREKKDAVSIFYLSFCILLFITCLLLLLVFFWNEPFLTLTNNSQMNLWIKIIPLAVLFTGSVKILRFWLLREKAFKVVALSRSGESVTSAAIKICIGFFIGSCTAGLILGSLGGLLVSLLIVLLNPAIREIKEHFSLVSIDDLKKVSVSYRKFPLFSTWNAILNMLSMQLVVLMFSVYFSPAVVGFYSLGSRVLKQPMIFISESIQNAYFQKAAYDSGQGQKLKSSFVKLTVFLGIIAVIPFTVLYCWGEPIFSFVFGQEWSTTGLYIKWMSPWFYLLFISTPANVVYEVLYKQDIKMLINITKLVACFCAIYFGYKAYHDALSTLKVFVVSNVIMELLSLNVAFALIFNQKIRGADI
jgi:O-antigen/teichoic acid export membrane protein